MKAITEPISENKNLSVSRKIRKKKQPSCTHSIILNTLNPNPLRVANNIKQIIPVRTAKNPTPNGYLTIRGCNNKDGTTQADYAAANAKQNAYLDSIGVDSLISYWFMGAGSGIEQAYDYLEVMGVSSMNEWGKMPDNFLTGNPAPQDLDALRDCDTPRVYSIQYVGGKN